MGRVSGVGLRQVPREALMSKLRNAALNTCHKFTKSTPIARLRALKLSPHYAGPSQERGAAAVVTGILKHADARPTDGVSTSLFQKAAGLAHALRMKTPDLLHIACAPHLAERRHTPSPR